MSDLPPRPSETATPRWTPISAKDRRVAGVLVEKAKTTPDIYPLSISALRSGCNQKNNRFPLMELEQDDIEESLERLKSLGAVTEVQSSSRVARYRHQLYEWLGIDKVELSVMAELLLRGAQTEGELRGRVSRMDNIPDLGQLRTMLDALKSRGLVISLTSEGRGHVVTHALYEPRELERLRAEHRAAAPTQSFERPAAQPSASRPVAQPMVNPPVASASSAMSGNAASSASPAAARQTDDQGATAIQSLRSEVAELRSQLEQVRRDLDDLWSNFR